MQKTPIESNPPSIFDRLVSETSRLRSFNSVTQTEFDIFSSLVLQAVASHSYLRRELVKIMEMPRV